MQSDRQRLLWKIRCQRLEGIIDKERSKLHAKYQQEQEQEFTTICPTLTAQNYGQHKHILSMLAANSNFSYRMVPIAGIVYQHLMSHPEELDLDSLRILRHLSQYEEVQVPQTAEFTALLLKLCDGALLFDALLIIANLLKSSRYQVLRDRLIEGDFPCKIQKILSLGFKFQDKDKDQMVMVMVTEILCNFITSHPLLGLQKIQLIVQVIKKTTELEQQKWQILASLGQLRSSTHPLTSEQKPNKKYSKILLNGFQQLLIKERHGSEVQILNFLIYAAYSEVYSENEKLVGLIAEVIGGKYTGELGGLDLALDCAGLYLQEGLLEIQGADLWDIFMSSQNNMNRQESVLVVLSMLEDQQLITSLLHLETRQKSLHCLLTSLQKSQTEHTSSQLLLKLLQQPQLKAQLQSLGLGKLVERLYEERGMEECEHLEMLMDGLADNEEL